MNDRKNPYLPVPATIKKITIENDAKDLKTFRIMSTDNGNGNRFDFRCGQFAMLSVPGAGECPIGIASSPLENDFIEFTVKRYADGVVTSALHNLEEGELIGIRGPYGNPFPLEEMEGKNVTIVGGGFAFTTLRSTIHYISHPAKRHLYKDITIVYGARSPGELLYKNELSEWEKRDDIRMHVTVDKGDPGWKGKEGFVPQVLQNAAPSPDNAIILVCGPPIMMKFTLPIIRELGFKDDRIFTSLERKMSCGIGKCGRCNIDSRYVCKDGPVFRFSELGKARESVF
jgi:NAD(P)H-flavin reductase